MFTAEDSPLAPFAFAMIFLLLGMTSLALWRFDGAQDPAARGTVNFEG
jgi:hypothetical protein